MHYTIDQVVRTFPDRFGHFCVYRVTGHVDTGHPDKLLELTELVTSTSGLLVHPDTVELYQTTNTFGTLTIGDTVRCMGLEGEHTLLGFYLSRISPHELRGIVSYGVNERGSIPWTIEYIKKA